MELFELLDELRILAENGRQYADDPYDEERYERVLELVGEWYGRTVDRTASGDRSTAWPYHSPTSSRTRS